MRLYSKTIQRILLTSIILLMAGFAVLSGPFETKAQITHMLNFAGKVTNTDGSEVTDGNYNFTFSLYDDSSSGTELWTETLDATTRFSATIASYNSGTYTYTYSGASATSTLRVGQYLTNADTGESVLITAFDTSANTITVVTGSPTWTAGQSINTRPYVEGGVIDENLGSVTDLSSVNFNQPVYLEITFNGETMQPRKMITAVAQAFNADKLDGYDASEFVNLSADSIVTGLWTFNNNLAIVASSTETALTITQNGSGDIINFFDSNGTEVFTATGAGNVGIGTSTPENKLDILGNLGVRNQNDFRLYELSTNGNEYVGFKASSTLSSNLVWTLPTTAGSNGDVLMVNSNGDLEWGAAGQSLIGNGTTGYFPYYASNGNALTATSTLFMDSLGNIGIGTTTPAYKLDVYGDARIDGNITANNLNITNWNTAYGWGDHSTAGYNTQAFASSTYLTMSDYYSSTTPEHIVGLSNLATVGTITSGTWQGDVIDTPYGGTGLDSSAWNGMVSVSAGTWSTITGTANNLTYWSDANTVSATSSIYLANNSNVGIGTTTPAYKLDVYGDARIDGNITANNLNITNWNTAYGWGDHSTAGYNTQAFASSTYLTMSDYYSSTTPEHIVGLSNLATVGTITSGTWQGDVIDTAYGGTGLDSSAWNGMVSVSAGTWSTITGTANNLAYWSDANTVSATSSIYLANNSNVGIGTSTPQNKLDIVGNLGIANQNSLRLYELGNNGMNYIGFRATSSLSSNVTYTWPEAGTSGQVLTLGSNNNLNWIDGGTVNSGTSGQFPYYASDGTSLTATSSLFIDSAGRIGIGTTSPSALLSLQGNAGQPILNIASSTGASLFYIDAQGEIGVGTTTPNSALAIASASGAQLKLAYSGSAHETSFTVGADGTFTIESNEPGNVYIDPSSSLGVGTSSPQSTLSVYGDVFVEGPDRYLNFGGVAGVNGYGIRDNGGVLEIKNSGSSWDNLSIVGSGQVGWVPRYYENSPNLQATSSIFISNAGYVGIGDQSPTSQLSLGGDIDMNAHNISDVGYINVNNTFGNGLRFNSDSLSSVTWGNDATHQFGGVEISSVKVNTDAQDSGSGFTVGPYNEAPTASINANGTLTLNGYAYIGGARLTLSETSDRASSSILVQTSFGIPFLEFATSTGEVYMFVNKDGWLGLNTNNPEVFLHVGSGSPDKVAGGENAYVEGSVEVDGVLYVDGVATSTMLGNIDLNGALSVGSDNFFVNNSGVLTRGTWQGTEIDVDYGGTGLTSVDDGYFLIGDTIDSLEATSTIFMADNGYIGIGSTTPGYNLAVNGTFYADDIYTSTSTIYMGGIPILTFNGTQNIFSLYEDQANGGNSLTLIATSTLASDVTYSLPGPGIVGQALMLGADNNLYWGEAGSGSWQGDVISVNYGGTGTSTAPSYGQILIGNASGGFDYIASSTLGGGGTGVGGTINTGSSGQISYYASDGDTLTATSSLYISSNGYLGIGTNTPENILDINGNLGLRNHNGLKLYESSANGGNSITLTATSSLTSDVTYTFPEAGSTGQLLSLGDNGNLYWSEAILSGDISGSFTVSPYTLVNSSVTQTSYADFIVGTASSTLVYDGYVALGLGSANVGANSYDVYTTADGATSVYAVDIDSDGDMDILSASYLDRIIRWYENDGAENFTAHSVYTATGGGFYSVYAVDIDSDGDMDILSASSDNTIRWYENDGAENFTAHSVYTTASGAYDVYATDIDSDGDMDIVSASLLDDTIRWYENDGAENFTAHSVYTTADGAMSVYAVDVDSDGDMDIVSASFNDDTIRWYENDGAENFTAHSVYTTADNVRSVYAVDVDSDGDMDILSASLNDNTIRWYENDGAENFTAHSVYVASGAYSVYAADIDGDGDMDILSASQNDDTIRWYENDGAENFTAYSVDTTADLAREVSVADIDGDGDTDILSASYNDDTVHWYETISILASEGTFISSAINIDRINLVYDTLSFGSTEPVGTDVKFQIRSASTEVGLESATWYGPSGTSDYYATSSGETINTVHNGDKYIQVKAYLSGDGVSSPNMNDFTISYEYATPGFTILDSGYVGIGTTTPSMALVVGGNSSPYFGVNDLGQVKAGTWQGDTISVNYGGTGLTSIDEGYLLVGGLGNTMSATSSIYIASTNRVGIGTTTPDSKLVVIDETAGSADNIFKVATSSNVFRITGAGDVYADGSFIDTGADYAEYFYTLDTDLVAGEVVCVDITNNNAVERCTDASDTNVMGVISTRPAIVGNARSEYQNNKHYVVVGMLGQVPAKVSDENGVIRPGDSLTSAGISGYTMKANPGDSTVGVALEGFGTETASGTPAVVSTGEIKILISRHNKSLTVDMVESKITDHIASMEIEDEVELLIANAVDTLNLGDEIQPIVDEQIALFDDRLSVEFDSVTNQLTTFATSIDGISARMNILENSLSSINSEQDRINDRISEVNEQLILLGASGQLDSNSILVDSVSGLVITNNEYRENSEPAVSIVEIVTATSTQKTAFVVNQLGDGDVVDFQADGVSIVNIADDGKVSVVGEMLVDGRLMVCSGTGCGNTLDNAVDETMGDMGVEGKVVAGAFESVCGEGFVWVPGSSKYGTMPGFCVMESEARVGKDGIPTTALEVEGHDSSIWVNVSQGEAQLACQAMGDNYHLITENEWLTIAENIIRVGENDIDTDKIGLQLATSSPETSIEFTLSNGNKVYDLVGSVSEWTDMVVTRAGLVQPTLEDWQEYYDIVDFRGFNVAPPYYYDSSNGIGRIKVGDNDNALRGFVRGETSLYDLDLSDAPTMVDDNIGFRCSK